MNAIATIEAPRTGCADRFRSQLIDRIARIEAWTVERLIAAGVDPRKAKLLGQRIEALRTCASAETSPFRNPERILKILDDLGPYLILRSAVAHATASTHCMIDGVKSVVFETPCLDPATPWIFRTTLRQDEFDTVLARVSSLANQLKQQTSA